MMGIRVNWEVLTIFPIHLKSIAICPLDQNGPEMVICSLQQPLPYHCPA